MSKPIPKTLEELTNSEHDSWEEVLGLISVSPNSSEYIPADPQRAHASIQKLQMTTRSYLGATVYHTGGMFFHDGLIRLYGSGSPQLPDFSEINKLTDLECYPNALLLGYDVLGGLFALDAGGLGVDHGSVCYMGPDTLEWQTLEMPHSSLLAWLIDGSNILAFYQDLLWNGWENDLAKLPEASGFSLFPPPSTTAWRDKSARTASPVPLMELCYSLHGVNAYSVDPR